MSGARLGSLDVEAASGTPLIELARFAPEGKVLYKAEHLLLTGSVFDRVAGRLLSAMPSEQTAVIAGSGSAALAFASAAERTGRKLITVCPEMTLPEHRLLLARHRVEAIFSSPALDLGSAQSRAEDEARRPEAQLIFGMAPTNEATGAFESSLGPELAEHLREQPVEALVAPLGVPDLLLALRERFGGSVPVFGVCTAHSAGKTLQDGAISAGEGRVLRVETLPISDHDAFFTRRALGEKEGLLIGLLGAAVVSAARRLVQAGRARSVLAIGFDAGDRYFSRDEILANQALLAG